MSAVIVSPPVRARPRIRRFWLPLALSLAIHVLLGLGAVLASWRGDSPAETMVPIDVVTVDTGCGTIVEDEPPRRPSPPAPSGAEEQDNQPFQAHIADLPLQSPISAAPPTVSGDSSAKTDGGTEGAGGASNFLAVPGKARRIVYVIDRSVSMGTSGALTVAKRELLSALVALPSDAQFAVILYDRIAEPLRLGGSSDLVAATPDNRAEVARQLAEVRASGATDHLAALRRAVALQPEIIFFVTDADDLTTEQVRNVMLFNHGGAAIHTVELNNRGQVYEETPLQLLAHLSGGTHRVVPIK